ncbi:hypothetical protein OOZ15_05260 [Galbibacter sp. EGI 63066]|uniref:hypothetical protein n=1 Tax=Galbibacter sp. EGI 63066 TaxID=2993559 RepID=UPI0022492DC4|nr:hypothetical protein [Galbibacter sp. EGI 63066]MCX2679344.1 hypothetical protein [Galbibacter sp. EGI 63066]
MENFIQNGLYSLIIISFLTCCNKVEGGGVDYVTYQMKEYLSRNDSVEFDNLIMHKSSFMPEDNEFGLLHRLYGSSLFHDSENIPYVIVDTLNEMGQLVIKVNYFEGYDSITAIKKIDLLLYFGPKGYFPLDKLSKFETLKVYDSIRRREIFFEKYKFNE